MSDKLEQIEFKGYKINIYPDNNSESPDSWGDDGVFLVGYHREFSVDRGQKELVTIYQKEDFKKDNGYDGRVYADGYGWKSLEEAQAAGLVNKQVRRGRYVPGISQGLAQAIARGGKYEDNSVNDEAMEYVKKYHIFGLEAYIHSGVALYLSKEATVDRDWDVSSLGLVFIAKTEARQRKSAEKLARGLLETWNNYLSGSVYGYMIEDPDGEESGGCWGFYGADYKASGLLEAAQGEIESALEQDKEIASIAVQAGA